MASYNELNALIDAYINRNGVQAITGQILNGVLKAMVEQLGRGYTIMGAATPTTDPGTPDGPECYFASETGTYTDFDGLQVVPGELALLCYTPTDGWIKNTIYEGFQAVNATIDGNVGTPSVGVSYSNGVLSFDFRNLKGNTGDPAGFGTIGATVDGNIGTPSVTVQESGPATAKNLTFAFTNLKGETGVTSVVATVDNTSGTPSCAVSLQGQQLTLAFTGLKGAQGNTGVSADYPIAIINNLTTDDPASALSAAQGVVLDGKVSQLEAKVDTVLLPTIEGKSITLNGTIGATINLTPVAESGWRCVLKNCVAGDSFTITGKGGVGTRLWGFVDSESKLIAVSASSLTGTNLKITAPAGAAYFVSNSSTSPLTVVFKGKDSLPYIKDKLDVLTEYHTIDVTGTGTWQVGRVLSSGFHPTYTSYRYMRFNAKKGDTINFKGYADSATIVFGKVVASNSITSIAMGAGTSTAAQGQYPVLEDAEFVICGYNNYTETVSIVREGVIPDIEERVEDIEEQVNPYEIDLLADVSWQTGRIIASDGYPNASYTGYHYAIFNLLKGDVVRYSGSVDSSSMLFGYAKPGIACFTSVSDGTGAIESGTFTAPYDCSIAICTYNNVSSLLKKVVPAIGERVKKVEGYEQEIAGIRNDLGSKTENSIEYVLVSGSYVNNAGAVQSLSGSRMTQPVLLQENIVVRITGVAPSTCSIVCRTNAEGSTYIPLVVGNNNQNDAFIIEYRVPETGYYAFSSTRSTFDIKQLSFSGALAEIDKLTKSVDDFSADGGNILAAFDNLVCVGDSLTWSMVYFGSGTNDQRQAKRTYPEVLAALCGNDYQLLATEGDTAKRCWDTQKNNIVEKENPIAIIYLGTNAGLTDSLDTDVVGNDPDNWADNNTGCYCRFVQKFQSLGYKVLLIKCWATSADLDETNTAIEHIATRFSCAVMNAPYTTARTYHYYPDLSGYNGLHYNDLGYAWFASMLIKESGKLPSDQLKLLIPNAS